jgi:pimeloyl-ACP methyl ester carboxylesterase
MTARRRWALVGAGTLVLLGIVVGAVVTSRDSTDSVSSAPAATAAQRSDAVTRPDGYTPAFRAGECDRTVTDVAPEATCGVLVVPEDRAEPGGRTIEIGVVRRDPPTPSSGPPVVVLDINELASRSVLPDGATTYFLWVRGLASMACSEVPPVWTAALSRPVDDPEAISSKAATARACADRLWAEDVRVAGYTMLEMAADLRDLVQVLGLGRVTVSASGLTTTAAAYFARTNPGSVAALLFANPTPPGRSTLADPTGTLVRGFGRLADRCSQDDECVARNGDLAEAYRDRFRELEQAPVTVTTRALSGAGPFRVQLDGSRLAAGLRTAMQSSERLGDVPGAVAAATPELIAAASINEDVNIHIGSSPFSAAYLSWTCTYDRRLNRTAQISDTEHPEFAGANDASFGPVCDSWSVAPVLEQLSQPLELDVPALLVEGGFSIAGINGWSDEMAELLPQAQVLRLDTLSEDAVFTPLPCLRQIRRQFVADPTDPLDLQACSAESPPIEFAPT